MDTTWLVGWFMAWWMLLPPAAMVGVCVIVVGMKRLPRRTDAPAE